MRFTDDALRAIEAYAWPGNVRQLLNVVKRSAIMADGNRVTLEDVGLPNPGGARSEECDDGLNLRAVREAAERGAVVTALARSNGNIVKASEILGVTRPTLYDLMNRLAIRVDR